MDSKPGSFFGRIRTIGLKVFLYELLFSTMLVALDVVAFGSIFYKIIQELGITGDLNSVLHKSLGTLLIAALVNFLYIVFLSSAHITTCNAAIAGNSISIKLFVKNGMKNYLRTLGFAVLYGVGYLVVAIVLLTIFSKIAASILGQAVGIFGVSAVLNSISPIFIVYVGILVIIYLLWYSVFYPGFMLSVAKYKVRNNIKANMKALLKYGAAITFLQIILVVFKGLGFRVLLLNDIVSFVTLMLQFFYPLYLFPVVYSKKDNSIEDFIGATDLGFKQEKPKRDKFGFRKSKEVVSEEDTVDSLEEFESLKNTNGFIDETGIDYAEEGLSKYNKVENDLPVFTGTTVESSDEVFENHNDELKFNDESYVGGISYNDEDNAFVEDMTVDNSGKEEESMLNDDNTKKSSEAYSTNNSMGNVTSRYDNFEETKKELFAEEENEEKKPFIKVAPTNNNEKKNLMRLVLISVIGILLVATVPNLLKKTASNEVTIQEISPNEKIAIGKQLLFMNTVMVKAVQETGKINNAIIQYENNELSFETLSGYIDDINKTFTYFYFATASLEVDDRLTETSDDMKYTLYLLRRSSEELLKFEDDRSSLRIETAKDLMNISKQESVNVVQQVVTKLGMYNIDPDKVSIDQLVWEKLDKFKQKEQKQFVFEDIETKNQAQYHNYVSAVNDGIFLMSWEMENVYKYKTEFMSGKISKEQLDRKLELSGHTMMLIVEQMQYAEPPQQLADIHKDVLAAFQYYHDGILTVQKFTMTGKVDYFDDGMQFFQLGNDKIDKAMQLLNVLKTKFGM